MARRKRRRVRPLPPRRETGASVATAPAEEKTQAVPTRRRRPFRDCSHVPGEMAQVAILSAVILVGLVVARVILR
jgi:hypothetical protein